ncbi:MAG TPA: 3-deoxy-D-manno-octulosonic acid transferase [Candidatus Limnocylindrales bacterium]|nr:3-deoxy-D-manno-octulosonic acid transferase [Candidatus Limnocylindrales bacterium]
MWFVGYNLLLTFVFLLTLPFTPILRLLGKQFSTGLWQRYGFFRQAELRSVAGSRPVWIHASSVGEVRSVAPLLRELQARHPQRRILLSTFTSTGNEIAKTFAGVHAVIFLPADFLWSVRRALTQWNPSLMIFVETEIWPNLLAECFRRGIPTVMVSGRLSARSYPRYARFRGFFTQVVRRFNAIGMQSREDAARIIQLGADAVRVSVVGSLKLSSAKPESTRFTQVPRHGKKLLIAGSTHAGEEEILLSSFALLRSKFPELSMVIAPRHPQRFDEVELLVRGSGFSYCRRSQTSDGELFSRDILLLDSLGELAELFACADVVFVGGSLAQIGGHNILEPARYGKAILFGPHMSNLKELAEEFKTNRAALEIVDGDDLSAALAILLSDEAKRIAMGQRALAASRSGDAAITDNYALAARYLSDSPAVAHGD